MTPTPSVERDRRQGALADMEMKKSTSLSNATAIGSENTDCRLFSKAVTKFVRSAHTTDTLPILMRLLTGRWKMSFMSDWQNKSVNRTGRSLNSIVPERSFCNICYGRKGYEAEVAGG